MPYRALQLVSGAPQRSSKLTNTPRTKLYATSPTSRSSSSGSSALQPVEEDEETLGNMLQRLTMISPVHVQGIETLVRHILASLEGGGRGLTAILFVAHLF